MLLSPKSEVHDNTCSKVQNVRWCEPELCEVLFVAAQRRLSLLDEAMNE